MRGAGEECNGVSAHECAADHECAYDDTAGRSFCRPLPHLGEVCTSSCIDAACIYGPTDGACVPTVCGELPSFGVGPPGPKPLPTPRPAP